MNYRGAQILIGHLLAKGNNQNSCKYKEFILENFHNTLQKYALDNVAKGFIFQAQIS